MTLILDEDVDKVAEFMMREVDATKLCFVADGLAQIARLLWGRYTEQSERPQIVQIERTFDGLSTRSRESQQPLNAT